MEALTPVTACHFYFWEDSVNITIGFTNNDRTIDLNVAMNADDLSALISTSLQRNELLTLTGENDHTVMINPSSLAFIDIDQQTNRRIGFGIGQ